jgi:hypothetical protein
VDHLFLILDSKNQSEKAAQESGTFPYDNLHKQLHFSADTVIPIQPEAYTYLDYKTSEKSSESP